MTAEGERGPFAPRDGASLAVLRIAFGLVLFTGVARTVLTGKVDAYWLEPSFHFTYYGFSWVRPLSAVGMYALFGVLASAALCITLGFHYRLAAVVYALGFTYTFLLEQARYLNHYYLVILLAVLLVLVPAHSALSLDARRTGGDRRVPAWSIAILRFQIGLVYLYAGIAKLNVDWLRARPLDAWLPRRGDMRLIGPLLELEATAWVFSYSGLLLDLLAWPLLVWKPTRHPMFLALLAFHLLNATLFNIGIFPWAMIALTTVFFEPDWPRRFLRLPAAAPLAPPSPRTARWTLAFLGLWVTIQVLFPLRHCLYPGSVHWTEEGHRFAWHMKLRDKDAEATFQVRDPVAGTQWLVKPSRELTSWQESKMAGRPDMILQYAHHLARDMGEGGRPLAVHAFVRASLNGRRPQFLVDPGVDLAREPRDLRAASWILPLEDERD